MGSRPGVGKLRARDHLWPIEVFNLTLAELYLKKIILILSNKIAEFNPFLNVLRVIKKNVVFIFNRHLNTCFVNIP